MKQNGKMNLIKTNNMMTNRDLYLSDYKSKLRVARKVGTKMMLTRMVYHNIKDLIPSSWEVEPYSFLTGLKIKPIDKERIMTDEFVKLTKKLAKKLHKEPSMDIDDEKMTASFYIYLRYNEDYRWESILIDIIVGNTEKCDIIVTKTVEEVEHRELTGYCKALKEKKFLEDNN